MEPILTIALDAARKASRSITNAFDKLDRVKISLKSNNDIVTETDKRAEQIIIETIHETYPEHTILAEESGEQKGVDGNGQSDVTWIIDPLDGTLNFSKGLPHFCISIAIREKNKIQHGLIYDPIRQELFTATRGKGAQLNNKRIRVSERRDLDGSVIGTGFPFRDMTHLDRYMTQLKNVIPKVGGVRRAGSAALDLAYVACGRLDAFWEADLNAWDIAAGVLMVREAGGLLCDFQGGESYLESGNVLASNKRLLKLMLQQIQG